MVFSTIKKQRWIKIRNSDFPIVLQNRKINITRQQIIEMEGNFDQSPFDDEAVFKDNST